MNYPRLSLARAVRFAVAPLALAAALAAQAAPAAAQTTAPNRPPSVNGKIVYASNERGADTSVDQIWVMDADGKRKTRLTATTASDTAPAWSPDGQTIAFNRNEGDNRLVIINADGTNPRQVSTSLPLSAAEIEWSPEGKRLRFETNFGATYVVQVFNPDGSVSMAAPVALGNFEDARWSPDGSKLVASGAVSGVFGVYTLSPDGATRTLLRPAANIATPHPVWSPDGAKVAYVDFVGGSTEVLVVNAAPGSTPVNVTNTPGEDESVPEWSPDGAKIAFLSSGETIGVSVVGAPGAPALALTRLADITGTTVFQFAYKNKLLWSPDGTMITFHDDVVTNQGSLANSQDIHVVDVDGSRLSNYTRSRNSTETVGNWQCVSQ